jgi:hypothetical protein
MHACVHMSQLIQAQTDLTLLFPNSNTAFAAGHEEFKEQNQAPCVEMVQLVLQPPFSLCGIISLPPQHIQAI